MRPPPAAGLVHGARSVRTPLQRAGLRPAAEGEPQSRALSSLPISDGSRVTVKPQAAMISSLASAVSAPPEISLQAR
jgi:hypothetical protein